MHIDRNAFAIATLLLIKKNGRWRQTMRFLPILGAALFAACAVPGEANVGTLTFSGTVLTLNGAAVTPVAGSVLGSITLSDGSDPYGPPATPDLFTGTVNFTDAYADPGNATFSYGTPLFGGAFGDMNPYHYASVTLVSGRLTGFNLFTDGDGDTFDISGTVGVGGSFEHDYLDDGGTVVSSDGGTFRLDTFGPPLSGTPEPAMWALLVTGFSLVGTLLRRQAREDIAVK